MIKKVGIILLILIGLLVFVGNFSEKERRYRCDGSTTNGEVKKDSSMYMKLNEYRWWVNLWSKSDGNLLVEIPNIRIEYYGNVRRVGDQFQFSDYKDNLKGYFSDLSKTIRLDIGENQFDGKCELIK